MLNHLHALDLQAQAAIDAALRESGLTGAQWRALDAALEQPGSSAAELARRCRVTPQSMQTIVANLEADGLLVRRPHPVHGRVLQIYVSNAGELRHVRSASAVDRVIERLFAAFTPDERRLFARLLLIALGTLRNTG